MAGTLSIRAHDAQFLPVTLDELAISGSLLYGAKALGCARMKAAGLPVPDGFALRKSTLDEEILAAVRACIARFSSNSRFAIRSSALIEDGIERSFAGVFSSRLNATGDEVIEAAGACFKEFSSVRSNVYGLTGANLSSDGAVLVQEMVNAESAGVAFSVDPFGGMSGQMIINAAWGLGDSVVESVVSPDEYRLLRKDGSVVVANIGSKKSKSRPGWSGIQRIPTSESEQNQQVLSSEQLGGLFALLCRVESLFGSPQDMEWCYDGSQFWLLQARPITVCRPAVAPIEWTRAHFRETLPDPTVPQTLHAMCRIIDRANRRFYGGLVASEAELGLLAKPINGRVYLNLSQMRHVCMSTGTPPAAMLREIGYAGEITDADRLLIRPSLKVMLRAIPSLARMGWWFCSIRAIMRNHFKALRDRSRQLNSRDIAKLADKELFSGILQWRDAAELGDLQKGLLMALLSLTRRVLESVCSWTDCSVEMLLGSYLVNGPKSVGAKQVGELAELARLASKDPVTAAFLSNKNSHLDKDYRVALQGTAFLQAFEFFLKRYGHRGDRELDWSMPRYSEAPAILLFSIQLHSSAPCRPVAAPVSTPPISLPDSMLGTFIDLLLRTSRRISLWRERERSEWIRTVAAIRRWHLALANRLVAQDVCKVPDDYFLLTFEELAAFLEGETGKEEIGILLAVRRSEYSAWKLERAPLRIWESVGGRGAGWPSRTVSPESSNTLSGLCVSAGCVEGEIVVMDSAAQFSRMKQGAIIVSPAADPSWFPLFNLAAGLVLEIGGILSHSATVARECGLPVLANVHEATTRLQDGDYVRLDATNGHLHILKRANASDGTTFVS